MVKRKKKNEKEEKINKSEHFIVNKRALIAAALNLILVGLGYAFLRKYKKAVISFIGYMFLYVIIFYIATFYPILIWLGIPITLFFVYDAYRSGVKISEHTASSPKNIERIEKPKEKKIPKGKFCTKCGTKIDENKKFCTNCGKKLEK